MRKFKNRAGLTGRQKFGIGVAAILIVVILILLYINLVVNPIIFQTSEAKVKALAQKAVGSAIYEIVSEQDVYNSLIEIYKDNEGNITMISANSVQINLLARKLSRLAQSNIDTIGQQGISIPLGTFSGMPILAGKGPNVSVSIEPIGAISASFKSEFFAAGVNQTIHKIFVTISSSLNVVLPTAHQKISTSSQVLVCESIIVGRVPEAFLNSDSLDEMMNLIPNS